MSAKEKACTPAKAQAQTTGTDPENIIASASDAVDAVAYFAHVLGLKAAQSQRGRWARLAIDAMQLTHALHVIGEDAVLEMEEEGGAA